jgi:hypothetical protein
VPDVHRRVRGVQPGDVGAQLADLGDQGLGLSHNTSISALTPTSTTHGGSTHEARSCSQAPVRSLTGRRRKLEFWRAGGR